MAFRGERYETLRVIASGGMATVHLGRALGAGGFERLVAIKAMHPHLASEPEFVAMFLDEARLAARIRHPNVVSTLDVQTDSQGVFLVMEYVEGPSLNQVFRALARAGRRLPLDIMLRIFLDTLAGLHAAHELRGAGDRPLYLVHRDVSPQNILIGVDGISRITDFGVASAEARLSASVTGQLKGKLGYMAPEQARSEPVDRRSDVYAAGALLWEALAAGRRFRPGSETDVLALVSSGEFRRPRDVNPSLPEALDECCIRAVQILAEDRYATAAEFAEAVERAAAQSGIEIASARAVAAFVIELDAHERPIALPAARPLMASLPAPISTRLSPPAALSEAEPALPQAVTDLRPEEVPAAREEPPAPEPAAESASPAGDQSPGPVSPASVTGSAVTGGRPSSRRLLWGAGAAAVIVLIVGVIAFQRYGRKPREAGTPPISGPASSGTERAPEASSAPVPVIAPVAVPLQSSAAIESPPDAGAAPDKRPPDGPGSGRKADVSKSAAGSARPAPSSPVYRPPEL